MNDEFHATLSCLAAEFRGFTRSTLRLEQYGKITPDEAIRDIREEFEQYDAMVKATWSFYSTDGGEDR